MANNRYGERTSFAGRANGGCWWKYSNYLSAKGDTTRRERGIYAEGSYKNKK
jgi:hypothetical protein